MKPRRAGVSALERVEALLANPALYQLADLVPERRQRRAPSRLSDLHVGALRGTDQRLRQRTAGRSRARTSSRVASDPRHHPETVPASTRHAAPRAADASPPLPLRPQPLPHRPDRPRRTRRHAPRARRRTGTHARAPRPQRCRLVDPPRPQPHDSRRRQGHHSPLQSQVWRSSRAPRDRRDLADALRTRRRAPLRRRR